MAVAAAGVTAIGGEASAGTDGVQDEPCHTGFTVMRLVAGHSDARQLAEYWEGVSKRHNPEKVFGPKTTYLAPPVRLQWKNLSVKMTTVPLTQKIQYINGFFNNWPSGEDRAIYGEEDYWATPEEFLEKGMGDCEDYALIKYMALRYFSWPAKDLWILLVRNHADGRHHAVLAVRDKDRIFILDNLSRPAYLLIPESQYLRNVTPLDALSEQGIWKFVKMGKKSGNSTTSIPAVTRTR